VRPAAVDNGLLPALDRTDNFGNQVVLDERLQMREKELFDCKVLFLGNALSASAFFNLFTFYVVADEPSLKQPGNRWWMPEISIRENAEAMERRLSLAGVKTARLTRYCFYAQ